MSSVVTWKLNLTELEHGKEVEFVAAGLASFEGMAVLIQRPDGSHFMWGVQSDVNGRVRDKIKLDSGLGQYLFCPRPACGLVNPRCAPLNVCPCAVSNTDCNIKVAGTSQLVAGISNVYQVTNLAPSKFITVLVSSNTGVAYELNGVSDIHGVFNFEFLHNQAGTYSLVFSDGACTSAPKIIEIINSQNEVPILRPENRNPCADGVDIILTFNKGVYAPSELGYVSVSICNKGAQFREISLTPSLILPGAVITSMPVPPVLGLPGYKCEEMVILFSAGPEDSVFVANVFGSYMCGGLHYTVNGGTTNALVGKGVGVCSAMLQYFSTVSGGTTATVNEEVELQIDVYNSGNKAITEANFVGLNLPANVTLVAGGTTTVGPILPGESKSIKVKVKASAPGTYAIQLAANGVTYKCTDTSIPLNSVGYVSLTVA